MPPCHEFGGGGIRWEKRKQATGPHHDPRAHLGDQDVVGVAILDSEQMRASVARGRRGDHLVELARVELIWAAGCVSEVKVGWSVAVGLVRLMLPSS